MKLSNLNVEEIGIIKNFIVDSVPKEHLSKLGFLNGENIKIIYKISGYLICQVRHCEIAITDAEAESIEIEKVEIEDNKNTCTKCSSCGLKCFLKNNKGNKDITTIKVALVGNPNCGKTTLFNFVSHSHEHVGNYCGATVIAKKSEFIFENYKIELIDLPGTYSLNSKNIEEKFTADYIAKNDIDVIVNVLDSTKLERSLFLTTQLQRKYKNLICAFNFFDNFEKYDFRLNFDKFENLTRINTVKIISETGFGIKDLFEKIINIHRNHDTENEQLFQIEDKDITNVDDIYAQVNDNLKFSEYKHGSDLEKVTTHLFDKIFLHKYFGFVAFFSFVSLMFFTTFYLGQTPTNILDFLIKKIFHGFDYILPNCMVKELFLNGILAGVGSIIIFIPQIFILYCFILFFEYSGYASRTILLIDRFMHKIGLHGESFIPLISGFGCNVPAILLTKTIKNKKNRLITALIIPMMSCPAKLPIYVMLCSLFFSPKIQSLALFFIYIFGFLVAILCSKIMNIFIKDTNDNFIVDIQEYKIPNMWKICCEAAHKCNHFLKNIGTIIVIASAILWGLNYFPHNNDLNFQQQQEQSYLGMFGKKIEHIFKPLGFNWKLSVSLVSGLVAKEVIAPSVSSFYSDKTKDQNMIKRNMIADGCNIFVIISFIIFILLYFPCLGTLAAINNEFGIKYAFISLTINTLLAYFFSFIFYKISLFISMYFNLL